MALQLVRRLGTDLYSQPRYKLAKADLLQTYRTQPCYNLVLTGLLQLDDHNNLSTSCSNKLGTSCCQQAVTMLFQQLATSLQVNKL